VLAPRQADVDYNAERWHDSWLFSRRTSATPNAELFVAPLSDFGARRLLLPHADDVKLEDFAVFDGHLALVLRRQGLQECRVHALPSSKASDEVCARPRSCSPRQKTAHGPHLCARGGSIRQSTCSIVKRLS
jgi:protease II